MVLKKSHQCQEMPKFPEPSSCIVNSFSFHEAKAEDAKKAEQTRLKRQRQKIKKAVANFVKVRDEL